MAELLTIPKYEAYKDSGIEFAGSVPEQWELLPIRAIFEERNEKNIGPRTDFILSVTKDRGVIPYDEKGAIGNNKSEDIERYKIVHENDLVINKMNVVIGSLGLSKYFGALSQVYIVLKPRTDKFDINYFSYIFSNSSFYKSLIKYCTGIMELRESLDKDEFKKLYLPVPSIEEQSAIAKFLDKKTAQIDEAIAIKEKQIELLKERKQIIIQQAVTQGLNPNVPMKNSGVSWIGEIPTDWQAKRIKHIAFIQNGQIDPKLSAHKNKILIAPNHIESATGRIIYKETAEEQGAESGKYPVKKGALLYSKIRPELRKACIAEEDGMCSADMYSIIPNQEVLPEFLLLVFLGEKFNGYMVNQSMRVAMPKVNRNDVSNYWLAIPPKAKQEIIVQHVARESKNLQSALDLNFEQIEKLKEYKNTLINSAVTGKIKVPGVIEG